MPAPVGGLPILGTFYPAGALPIVDPQGGVIPNLGTPVASTDAANKAYVDSSTSAGVTSFKTRTGPVTPAANDYAATQVANDSATVAGTHVSDALDALKALIGSLVFPDIATLVAYPTTGLANGTLSAVANPNDIYELILSPSAAILAATDGVNIIQPTSVNTTRWIRRGLVYSFVSDWYVNGVTGNDANDGSITSPLKTLIELTARLCPGGSTRTVYQNTFLHVAAGTYTAPAIRLSFAGLFTVKLQCAFTSSANLTVSSVAATVAGTTTVGSGTRGQIGIVSGTLAVNQLLRCVSGSHVGAVAYVQELNGDAQHAFVTAWVDLNNLKVDLIVGDVIVIDTPTVDMDHLDMDTHNGATVRVEYLGTSTANVVQLRVNPGDIDSIQFYACRGYFQSNFSAGANFWCCAGTWYTEQGYWRFLGTHFCTTATQFDNCIVELAGPDCVFGAGNGVSFYECQAFIGKSFDAAHGTRGNTTGFSAEKITAGGGNTGLYLWGALSSLTVANGYAIWGVTGASTGWAFYLEPSCVLLIDQASPQPTMFAAFLIGTNAGNRDYAHMPFQLGGSSVFNLKQANSEIASTSLTNVVALTNVYSSTPSGGTYLMVAYLTVKTVGTTGMFAVFAQWTDDVGVQKQRITDYLAITSTGSASGTITVRSSGAAAIQYSVEAEPSHTFTAGSLVYSLALTTEKKASI
jgi:hypothetical protein